MSIESSTYELYLYPIESNLSQKMKYKLTKKENIIGRSKHKCDISLIFQDISEVHAKLTINGINDYMIKDLNSEAGVFRYDPETSTKQRLIPFKDYDISLDVPFYISKYRCIFTETRNSAKISEDTKSERENVQKTAPLKNLTVYGKKFKPKGTIQADIKENVDDDDELLHKERIQEENRKRLLELNKIEEEKHEEDSLNVEPPKNVKIDIEEESEEKHEHDEEPEEKSEKYMKEKTIELEEEESSPIKEIKPQKNLKISKNKRISKDSPKLSDQDLEKPIKKKQLIIDDENLEKEEPQLKKKPLISLKNADNLEKNSQTQDLENKNKKKQITVNQSQDQEYDNKKKYIEEPKISQTQEPENIYNYKKNTDDLEKSIQNPEFDDQNIVINKKKPGILKSKEPEKSTQIQEVVENNKKKQVTLKNLDQEKSNKNQELENNKKKPAITKNFEEEKSSQIQEIDNNIKKKTNQKTSEFLEKSSQNQEKANNNKKQVIQKSNEPQEKSTLNQILEYNKKKPSVNVEIEKDLEKQEDEENEQKSEKLNQSQENIEAYIYYEKNEEENEEKVDNKNNSNKNELNRESKETMKDTKKHTYKLKQTNKEKKITKEPIKDEKAQKKLIKIENEEKNTKVIKEISDNEKNKLDDQKIQENKKNKKPIENTNPTKTGKTSIKNNKVIKKTDEDEQANKVAEKEAENLNNTKKRKDKKNQEKDKIQDEPEENEKNESKAPESEENKGNEPSTSGNLKQKRGYKKKDPLQEKTHIAKVEEEQASLKDEKPIKNNKNINKSKKAEGELVNVVKPAKSKSKEKKKPLNKKASLPKNKRKKQGLPTSESEVEEESQEEPEQNEQEAEYVDELDKRTSSSNYKGKFFNIGISGFILEPEAIINLKKIGIRIIEDKQKAINILILQSFKRTIRFLMALNKGVEIVDRKWIDDCIKQDKMVDYNESHYQLKCKSDEKKFDFNLQDSLSKARQNPDGVLSGYSFWMPRNILPSYEEMKILILSGGGNILSKKPLLSDKKCFIIMPFDDMEKVAKLKEEGYKVYGNEMIFSGCLKQELEFENNML